MLGLIHTRHTLYYWTHPNPCPVCSNPDPLVYLLRLRSLNHLLRPCGRRPSGCLWRCPSADRLLSLLLLCMVAWLLSMVVSPLKAAILLKFSPCLLRILPVSLSRLYEVSLVPKIIKLREAPKKSGFNSISIEHIFSLVLCTLHKQ